MVGDKAYDSDALDKKLLAKGIKLISPHKSNRKSEKTQDGRELRSYKIRWRIERFFAWLHNFRRVVTRWDTKVSHFEGFVNLACIMILGRNLF